MVVVVVVVVFLSCCDVKVASMDSVIEKSVLSSERFSLERRKIVDCALLRYTIGLKNSRNFFILSEVKPKPIVTRSRSFLAFASAT